MDKDQAFMRIQLGLKSTPSLIFNDIAARAREVFAVVHLGRPELSFLAAEDIVGRCGQVIQDGFIDLLVPLPSAPQPTMSPPLGRGRKRNLLGMLGRDDDGQDANVNQIIERVQRNADLVTDTAHVMNTAADVGEAHKRIEEQEGVALRAARDFHRKNRGERVVEIAGCSIPFRSRPVRVGVADQDLTEGLLILSGSKDTHTDFRGAVGGAAADLFGRGFKDSKRNAFRVGSLSRWQRIVLDGARHLGLPVVAWMKAVKSTLSLKQRRLEIHHVANWDELLDEVIEALLRAQEAGRKGTAP